MVLYYAFINANEREENTKCIRGKNNVDYIHT